MLISNIAVALATVALACPDVSLASTFPLASAVSIAAAPAAAVVANAIALTAAVATVYLQLRPPLPPLTLLPTPCLCHLRRHRLPATAITVAVQLPPLSPTHCSHCRHHHLRSHRHDHQ